MAVTLNETPSGNRLHIGIFGKTNSGKSSFINTFSGKEKVIINNGKFKYRKELAKQSNDLRCAVNWFIEVDGGTRLYACLLYTSDAADEL